MLKFGKLIAVFSIVSAVQLQAQSNESYLLYDAACVQKFDYERSQEYSDLAFWDYQLRLSPGKTLVLRVLKQETYIDEIAALDKEPLRCNDPKLMNDSFINELNSSKKSLSIAEYDREKKNYRIYSVKKVMLLNDSNFGIDLIGDYKLHFTKNSKEGDNIDSSGGRVLYMGTINIQCFKVQHFRAYDKQQPRFSEDFYFAEQLGLIKIVKDQGSLDLAYINGVDINDYIKSRCKLPETKPQTPKDTFVLDSAGYYTVKSGDNLYRLASFFNTRVDVIMGLNNLKTDALKLGQKLRIKDDGTYKDINPVTRKDESSGMSYKIHIVRQGEILQDIAQKYKTTVLNIMKLNNMENTKIEIFQELIIEIIKP